MSAARFIYLHKTTACAAYLSFIVGMIVQLAPQWGEERVLLAFFPLLVLLSWFVCTHTYYMPTHMHIDTCTHSGMDMCAHTHTHI